MRSFAVAAVVCALGALPRCAHATPHPLPFTYNYATLGEGELEIEQIVDYTPVRIQNTSGNNEWYAASQFQTEFEYGLTNRLELGLYVAFEPRPSDLSPNITAPVMTEGNGIKQRLRYRIADAGVLPVDLALYGELCEFENEFEFEGKVIVEKRLGNLTVVTNLWAEAELYYNNARDIVLNPTLGLTYQVSPTFSPGIESWMRVEFPTNPAPVTRPFNLGPHLYVGPAALLSFGKIWWSTGVYLRATNDKYTLNPTSPGGPDTFGFLWVRSIIGLNL